MSFYKYGIGLVLFLILAISCGKSKKDLVKNTQFLDQMDLKELSSSEKEGLLNCLFNDAMDSENSDTSRAYLLELASRFDEEGESRSLKILNRVRAFSKEESDSLTLAKTFESLGDYYESKMQFDSTYFFYQQSGKWYTALNDSIKIAEMSLAKASILYDFGFYTDAEVETIRALRYASNKQSPMMVYESYQLLGLVLCELNSFEESISYYQLTQRELQKMNAEGSFDSSKLVLAYGALYNNFGGAYEVHKEFEKAIEYYQKGLDVAGIDENNPAIYSALLNNNSFARMQVNDTVGVLGDLKKAEAIRLKNGTPQEVITSKLTIGEYYFNKNQIGTGLQYIYDAYDLAISIKSDYDQKEALKFLVEHDAINKSKFTREYVRILEKIQAKERSSRNKFARIAYETEEMINKNERLAERNRKIIFLALVSVGFLMFLLLLLRLSSRNKRLIMEQKQQAANQQIYQLIIDQQHKTQEAKMGERTRIAKELHDGIVNRIFTTRFNLMQLDSEDVQRKDLLVQELVKAEEDVRTISHKLSDRQFLEDTTFEEVVKKLIEMQQNSFGTKFELSIDRGIVWGALSTEVKMHLYRILQEVLQNVNKYSRAKQCTIYMLKSEDKTILRISDDGIGFDIQKIKRGLGFKNLSERIAEIGGELVLDATVGKGVTLEIIF